MRGIFLLSVLVNLSSCAPVYRHASSQALQQKLQDILDKHSRFWNMSFSFAVYNSSVEVAVASGLDDYSDSATKLTIDSQIPMGSTTKLFTSTTALRLAQQGLFKLDDPVAPLINRYLESPQPCNEAPTMCEKTCAPLAHCYVKPSFLCKLVSKDKEASCSYCMRYLHCYASSGSSVPSALTLQQATPGLLPWSSS